MKNHLTPTNLITRLARFGLPLAALALFAVAATSASAQVLQPSTLPYGLSYQEWSAKWWQWSLGRSTNHLEYVGDPGVCEGRASRVRFLAGAPGTSTETRKVTIPAETPLFFSILSVWVDNTGCPTFTTFTADELAAQAAGIWSVVSVTSCAIDGVAVAGLNNPAATAFLAPAPAFSYTTAERGNVLAGWYGEPCIPGGLTVYPAVADGVYLMLAPLSPGRHLIHFVGVAGPVSAPFVKVDITYEITVSRDAECGAH